MKKLTCLLICIFLSFTCVACSTGTLLPNSNKNNHTTSTNKNSQFISSSLKLYDTIYCKNCSLKFANGYNSIATYYITPNGFDLDALQKSGYYMEINVTYNVYYKKDWSLGIGYFGSPKYEISILNSDLLGKSKTDLTTTTKSTTRYLLMTSAIADLLNTRLTLTFSTDNIQNIIYFSNIKVSYRCFK